MGTSLNTMDVKELDDSIAIRRKYHDLARSVYGHHRWLHIAFLSRRKKQSCIDRYIDNLVHSATAKPTEPTEPTKEVSSPILEKLPSNKCTPLSSELKKSIVWLVGAAQFVTSRPGFNGKCL
jgi:hypothetical protein